MNDCDLHSSYRHRTIAAAWGSQAREADKAAWLADALTECGDELFPRFAASYAELRALPRSARRALQRQLARSSDLAAILPDYLQQGARRLQHRMAWSLAGAALLLALGQGVATAATITVTTNNPDIAADDQCSLIEAIVNANNDAATHPDCPAGSGADTIVLPAHANVLLTSVSATTSTGVSVGLPVITSRMTIEGNGSTIHRQENAPAFGLMGVTNSGDLTLQSVILSGGVSRFAGGMFNSGTLAIKNSMILSNAGGGILNDAGTLTVEHSTIANNAASFSGGGFWNRFGNMTMVNSTVSGNTAGNGGGISNYVGRLTITNSTISGNGAEAGGGVSNVSGYYGGGGIVTLHNSLIAGNQAAHGSEVYNSIYDPTNAVVANDYNIFGSSSNAGVSGFTPGPTDVVPSVPLSRILGPLQNNGGPTRTHALVDGSPALDAGDPGGCRDSQGVLFAIDQRGLPRHVDSNNDGAARCDIGAFEAKELFLVAAVLPSSRSVQVNGVASAFATMINAGQKPATDCTISPLSSIPATFAHASLESGDDVPVDMPAGAAHSFVFLLSPTAPIAPTDVQLRFECANANAAPIIPGLNTLLFSASAIPVADIVAMAATLNDDGIVNIPEDIGTGVFAVATVNVGTGDTLTVSANTGSVNLPINLSICQTNSATGICFGSLASSVTTQINAGQTPTFAIFVAGTGAAIPFDPANNRIFVRFKDTGGAIRGATSVAVRTSHQTSDP